MSREDEKLALHYPNEKLIFGLVKPFGCFYVNN